MDGRPAVDREACLGTGMCVVYAPNTFAHDDESKAVVADPAGDPAEVISTAVEACPMGALSLVADETGA
ncbi:ferredoxin [Amycolatopsis sp. K13G38]|uniref:Ferredoxin n=1 Tax=Amycolatopsis acididurans TaxID=2724524 RepID=A0ABX1J6M4_9PSEU|nr:ferredoxin [Amycolatopsis acididurans]NKQ53995.1 ferredoxin [Amycolatopsis acididurans]